MIDLELIAEKLEFDLEDIEMLLDLFLNDALESLSFAKTAISTNDFKEMKNIAHGIKGSASNLLLEEITQSAYEIEQLAKNKSNANYTALFNTLNYEIELLKRIKA